MKKILGLVFLVLFLISATEIGPVKPQTQQLTLDGAWELVNHYNYDGENVTDTIPNPEGYRQIKMYNEGRVMWTRYVPRDSVEWFAYGSYKNTSNELKETLEYGSASIMKALDTMRVFSFELLLQENSFSQITIDEEGNRTFSENYKRIH